MPYYPIIPQTSDRRAKQGAIPTKLRNCMLEKDDGPQPKRRSPYFIVPTPGRTRRATLQANCRGLFSEPGVRESRLFAPAGGYFNEVYPAWGYGSVGTITGADVVQMVPFQSSVGALALGEIYLWDGSTFGNVTDADAPSFASTLASVAYRLVAANQNADGFSWSKAGLYNDWDPNGNAADIYLPDPIVNQVELSGDLLSLGSRSTQLWQPTGGAEDEAFATVSGQAIRMGLLTRDAIARAGQAGNDAYMFLGHDRRIYRIGGGISPIENRDLEVTLRDMDEYDLHTNARAWSYTMGGKTYWGLSLGLERAFVYDVDLSLWHERTRYGESVYDIDFATSAFDNSNVVVAGYNSAYIWTLDDDVFTDDGDPIEREFTIHVSVGGDVSVDRIVFDAEWRKQPTSGQGVAPQVMLSVSMDGGNTWCDERVIDLPALGEYGVRVQDFCFGLASAEHGALIRGRITDPIGFAIWGYWVNPSESEIP